MKKTTFALTFLSFLLLPSFVSAEELATPTTGIVTSSSSFVVTTTDASSTSTPLIKPFTLCSQEAIEKRDTDIAASRSLYNVAMTNALNERKNKEKAAVALENEKDKKDAIKLSVDTYKNQTKSAQNNLTQTRKILWQNFENDIKKCRENEESLVNNTTASKANISEEKVEKGSMMSRKTEEADVKTIKETLKGKIDTFFSLFN